MTGRAGKVLLKVHPLLPLLFAVSVLLGSAESALASLCALILHETGHILPAMLLGQRIAEVEITPFGAVMTLPDWEDAGWLTTLLIAAGGPLFSFLSCFLTPLLARFSLSFSFLQHFSRSSLLLLLVNLLPVLPLDGGRMAEASLGRIFPARRVQRILNGIAFAAGAGMAILSLIFALKGKLVLFPCFAGLYLIYAAAVTRRGSLPAYVTGLIARRQRLDNGEMLQVEAVAARGDTLLRALLPQMRPGKYHYFLILAPDGITVEDMMDEKSFCDRLLNDCDARLSTGKSRQAAGEKQKKSPVKNAAASFTGQKATQGARINT